MALRSPSGEFAFEPMKAAAPILRKIALLPGCGHWTQQEWSEEMNAGPIDLLRCESRLEDVPMIADSAHKTDAPRPERILRSAALIYTAAFMAHNADHFRRGFGVLIPEVFWAGTVTGVVAVVAIALALFGSPLAPLVAVVHGFSQAVGVAAVHLLPPWGAFSDSVHHGVDALSWAAVLAEIAGALAFGVAGAYALYRQKAHADARVSAG